MRNGRGGEGARHRLYSEGGRERAKKNVVEMVALTEIGFCEDGSEGRGVRGRRVRDSGRAEKGENAKQLGC